MHKAKATDDNNIVGFDEITNIFTVESNDLLFKALSSKLVSHWKKVITKTKEDNLGKVLKVQF